MNVKLDLGKILAVLLIALGMAGCGSAGGDAPLKEYIIGQLEFNRSQTLKMIDKMEKHKAHTAKILAWEPPTGRATIGWQLLHIAASEDGLVTGAFKMGKEIDPELRAIAKLGKEGRGKLPELSRIKDYLKKSRAQLLATIPKMDFSKMDEKPSKDAWSTRRKLLHYYLWHEGHHQGQAHISLNMYLAKNGLEEKKKKK